jgi:hypothetical protein
VPDEMGRRLYFAAVIGVAASCIALAPVLAQQSPDTGEQTHKKIKNHRAGNAQQPAVQAAEPRKDRRLGRLHDRLRRNREREGTARANAESFYADYLDLKKTLDGAGISYMFQPGLMSQWGFPNGGKAAVQGVASVSSFNWDFPDLPSVGRGSLQFGYFNNHYFLNNGRNAAEVAGNIGVLTPINDSTTTGYVVSQLTYTHEFPNNLLEIVIGQYPFWDYDGNNYAGNQQVNFVNYSLAQNASAAYLNTSLGGSVQVNATPTLSFAAGAQDANNVAGRYIQTRTFGEGPWAWFGYAQWNPAIQTLGPSQFSLLYYEQPAVTAQPLSAQGWSFNGTQDLNATWSLFARLNTSSGAISQIKTSVAGGFIYKDPLGREPDDQVGVGLAWNITNQAAFVGQAVRPSELVIDTYWNYVVKKWLLIGPDFQFIVHPALNPNSATAEVLTLRMTGLF